MKIVVPDGYAGNPNDLSWEPLARLGELTVHDRTPDEELITCIGDADVVLTNKATMSREIFDACPNLKYVGVFATGYNVVDLAAAKEHGVVVTNVPGYSTASVAQMVFALLLELCHHAGHHSQTVHAGRWSTNPDFCYWDFPLVELDGKTMGVVGYGAIGKAVAKIASALGMKVLACGGARPVVSDQYAAAATLDQVLAQADVISLHCPLNDSSRGLINKDSISKMKDGVLLINTARGPLIAEADLRAALDSGKVAGTGLDVLCQEPPETGSPLIGAPNCVITPHIAWAPREARQRLMELVASNLKAWVDGAPINVVNP